MFIHTLRKLTALALVACLTVIAAESARAEASTLKNDKLTATFDDNGLAAIKDAAIGKSIGFKDDSFSITLGDKTYTPATLGKPSVKKTDTKVVYSYAKGDVKIDAVYELKADWRFVTKLIRVSGPKKLRVNSVDVLTAKVTPAVSSNLELRGRGGYGMLLRFDGFGMFGCVQNPYNHDTFEDGKLVLAYKPEMDWDSAWGPFESDRACLGTYALSDMSFAAKMLPEWHYVQKPDEYAKDDDRMDVNAVLALADCVRAFTTYKPTKSIRLHVDWCENVYQLDLAKPEHWEEYKRIIVRAGEVGCDHLLFSPQDTNIAKLEDSRDAWRWESLLWLNMGQKIRTGEWVAGKDPLPEIVKERIKFVEKHGMRIVPYIYPSLPFMQDPEWTAWVGRLPGSPKPGGYRTVDTGMRSFQDWFVKQAAEFQKQTGAGGYAIDHWWIAYPETSSSKYAQWYGCRRMILELRKACPDIVIDGRQQYQGFGPWTWLGGSYPHPMASDEQPGSFRAFPDLHFSRVSADRTRNRNFWFRVQNFAPVELVPGFTTHQTMRSDKKRVMRRDPYRRADWDYLGWKYSIISSLATAPYHHVVNYIPARSVEEFKAFAEEDKKWIRDWFDWTDDNMEVLSKLRPIIGQPMVGRCDGTAAIDGDQGFVFLFNPNYRPVDAKFKLDESIGLSEGKNFVFRQLYPDLGKGQLIGNPASGSWSRGGQVALPMRGASALVLELVSLPEKIEEPMLLNSPGKVAIDGGKLQITGAAGEPGTDAKLAVLLPEGKKIDSLSVNGKSLEFKQDGGTVTATVPFAGDAFGKLQQVGTYDDAFNGSTFKSTFNVPPRIVKQLEARRTAWPIPYDEDEIEATWTAPWRMLMFINIADPKDAMEVSMKIDGKPVEVKKAYSSIYAQGQTRTFVGFYADLSGIEADKDHEVEVSLPDLQPGQFQGLFFDTVEPEYTEAIR